MGGSGGDEIVKRGFSVNNGDYVTEDMIALRNNKLYFLPEKSWNFLSWRKTSRRIAFINDGTTGAHRLVGALPWSVRVDHIPVA